MAGETILVVEDAPISLKLTATILRGDGYKVQIASSAEQALSSLPTMRPDLMLLDIMLPGMSGIEMAKRLKQDARLRDVLVIALTAGTADDDRQRAIEAGFDGFLSKPVESRSLVDEVRQFLDGGTEVPPVFAPAYEQASYYTPPHGYPPPGYAPGYAPHGYPPHYYGYPPPPPPAPPPPPERRGSDPLSFLLPQSEMEDLQRSFLTEGTVQSRQLLASLEAGIDEAHASRTVHPWIGTGGLLGYPKITEKAREAEIILRTPPLNYARLRVALTNLVRAFEEPAVVHVDPELPRRS